MHRSLAFVPFSALLFVFNLYPTDIKAALHPSAPSLSYPRFYGGLIIGYGKTSWNDLVTHDPLAQMSAPKSAKDFGLVWGGFLSYQWKACFAIEANYKHFPGTYLTFNHFSFYYPTTQLTTHTQVYSTLGKFILPLTQTGDMNTFLDAGISFIQRHDQLAQFTHVSPRFGLGVMLNMSRRLMTEVGLEYHTGYGKSNHLPVKDFLPFLFDVYFKLAYRFI